MLPNTVAFWVMMFNATMFITTRYTTALQLGFMSTILKMPKLGTNVGVFGVSVVFCFCFFNNIHEKHAAWWIYALLSEILVQMFSDVAIVFLCEFQIYFDFHVKQSSTFQLAHRCTCITSITVLKYYTHPDTPTITARMQSLPASTLSTHSNL